MEKRVKIQQIIESQLPQFVRDEFPLVSQFLKQYYISQEAKGLPVDILSNIDQYIKLEETCNLYATSSLFSSIGRSDTTIQPLDPNFTTGFPDRYGLIQIDDEIIMYEYKDDRYFYNCHRGFSGVTSLRSTNDPSRLTFSESRATFHDAGTEIKNLSVLFLQEFLKKTKSQFIPGFSDRKLDSAINKRLFISRSRDFYESKGTDRSFKILFNALYGEPVDVVRPSDYLFKPSDAGYSITKNLVVEVISGNGLDLLNKTLIQDAYPEYGIPSAKGSITDVEKFILEDKTYYTLKLDFDYNKDINARGSVDGEFQIHPKTKITFVESLRSEYLTVDSTIGFPEKGVLSVNDSADDEYKLAYFSKNINQFESILPANSAPYTIYGTDVNVRGFGPKEGWFYPLFLNESDARDADDNLADPHKHTFIEYPGVTFWMPSNQQNHAKSTTPDTITYLNGRKFDLTKGGVPSTFNRESDVVLDVYAKGYVTPTQSADSLIKVRIGGVLSGLDIYDTPYGIEPRERIFIKTLGSNVKNIKTSGWITNTPVRLNVKSITLSDRASNTYTIITTDDHSFQTGDSVIVTDSLGNIVETTVGRINSENNFQVTGSVLNVSSGNTTFKVERLISKVQSNLYDTIIGSSANIQNIYNDFEDNVLIASNSLPRYPQEELNPYLKKYTLSGSYSGETITLTSSSQDHGLFTGDSVYYRPFYETIGNSSAQNINKFDDISEGIFYVKRINSNSVKLSRSQSDLFANKFVSFTGTVTNNSLEYYDFNAKYVEPQQIVRRISSVDKKSGEYETHPGSIGVLINGTEILNYKSSDAVYYNSIESVDVKSPGFGYDIISPPVLEVSDSVGAGATLVANVVGSLERIDIVYPGFDFIEKPVITITGGNGSGASAKVNTTSIEHRIDFRSDFPVGISTVLPASQGGLNINVVTNEIGFGTYHKFRDNERVIYETFNQQAIAGLTTSASYYVKVLDGNTVKLHKNVDDSISGINTVSLVDYGVGVHALKSAVTKSIVTNIIVDNPGFGYENKKRDIPLSGINTALDLIRIKSHGYKTGEEVVYESTETSIGGLTSSTSYIVKSIDENTLSLYSIGVGQTNRNHYIDNDIKTNLTTSGIGSHFLNYPPIKVEIKGKVGVSTLSDFDFNAQIQPIFRGSIETVQTINGGVGYGASEILNYLREPNITPNSGKNAQLSVVVQDNSIKEILILNGGSGYNSPPNLLINGRGKYAKLTPIIQNGSISEVRVINGGIEYDENTTISVIAAGQNSVFSTKIQSWNVNNFQKYYNIIKSDDGIIDNGLEENSLQYFHLYAPRSLRQNIFARSIDTESFGDDYSPIIKYGVYDLIIESGSESNSVNHSPIIGWAYDGNPIYGPYGYSNPEGGVIRQMKTGYQSVTKENRPPLGTFPKGFFVEDFEYDNSIGDLDDNNGRFCITPDYPDGTYAYFSSLNADTIASSGPFDGFKEPVFPYFIGQKFHNKPDEFNFRKSSNQYEFDFQNSNYFRNTYVEGYTKQDTLYPFVNYPNRFKKQITQVQTISTGNIQSVGIETGGDLYKVGDNVVFGDTGEFTSKAVAKVERVSGKTVDTVSVASTEIPNIEFAISDKIDGLIGFSSVPHGLKDRDLVTISGFSTHSGKIDNFYTVGIRSDNYVFTLGIGTAGATGIVTYFYVSGILKYPNIRENDVLSVAGIGTTGEVLGYEQVKVLNIDSETSRIRVLRGHNNTVSFAYTAQTNLLEIPRKFNVSVGLNTTYNFPINRELYFDPSESVGVGTNLGIGAGSTITFANPGVGNTQVFVPTRQIFIPNHGLKTNNLVEYKVGDGSALLVSSNAGITTFDLNDGQLLYVANIGANFIGLSTAKVSIANTGSYVGLGTTTSGLLYFAGIGTGSYHSIESQNSGVVKAKVSKNVVTVSTASTHGLLVGDEVGVDLKSGITTTITVKYNDHNRRIVFNSRDFESNDVDINTDLITIINHGYSKSQKVIYGIGLTEISGLNDQDMYYISVFDDNNVGLCTSKFDVEQNPPKLVNIQSKESGSISPVNPSIRTYYNNKLEFNLGDPSLSSPSNGVDYSAFDMKFYRDSLFVNEFKTTGTSDEFEIQKSGRVGIDSTSTVTVSINESVPGYLYYKFDPINTDEISRTKIDIVVDDDVTNANQIQIRPSIYNGLHEVTSVASTSFTYNSLRKPEYPIYTDLESKLSYDTNSNSAFGPISTVDLTFGGNGYRQIPGISTVTSEYGSGAILKANSTNIGVVGETNILDIGYEYPVDNTLRPTSNLPQLLSVVPLTSFDFIGIASVGVNYLTAPDLVVLDGFTKKVVSDVKLEYEIGDTQVTILENTFGMNSTTPVIIPINNSNGVGIKSMIYDDTLQNVIVTLDQTFSDTFPFSVGDKVLVENTGLGIGSTGRGYNSSQYEYTLFELTSTDPNLGGADPTITYSLSDFLKNGENPGVFKYSNSAGRVIPSKFFPQFDIKLTPNNYFIGERVVSKGTSKYGIVEGWNPQTQNVKVSSEFDFLLGETLEGTSSRTQGVVSNKVKFRSSMSVDYGSTVKSGWKKDTGFLNNNTQAMPDNEYYQYFSYALKSKVSLDKWNDAVSSLVHTPGFVKFSDHVIETPDDRDNGRAFTFGDESVLNVIVDYTSVTSLDCYTNFDLVSENFITANSRYVSDEIHFKSKILTDYLESIGNRVLLLDDISNQFNSFARATRFDVVDLFDVADGRAFKYLIYVRDKVFTGERQAIQLTLFRTDIQQVYLSQYGSVSTTGPDLGSFDVRVLGSEGQLLFYPVNFRFNDYEIANVSIDISTGAAGIGTTDLGDIVRLESANNTGSGTTTVVSIAATYRASKIINLVSSGSTLFQFDEISYVYDDTDNEIYFLDYGTFSNDPNPIGLGTYTATYQDGNVDVLFIPHNVGIAYSFDTYTVQVGIATTTNVSEGSQSLIRGNFKSTQTSIGSTPTPTAQTVCVTSPEYKAAYYVLVAQDTTNNRHVMSEFIAVTDDDDVFFAEYGTIETVVGVGTVGFALSTSGMEMTFTPEANADTDIKVYQKAVSIDPISSNPEEIDLTNITLDSGFGDYEGTEKDRKKSFFLTHEDRPVFQRNFDAESSSVVNVVDDTVEIPNHFFVTGEQLSYTYPGAGTTQAIGIGTTVAVGVGTTDKLPSTVFVVKVNESKIKFANTAENALRIVPQTIDLTTVGIGVSHTFTSLKQNAKCLINIDNITQSPIVSTATTTALLEEANTSGAVIKVTGISSIFGGDFLKVNDEILRVQSVGYGATNQILVERAQVGTGIATHEVNALITKIKGDYNIVNNYIHFVDAPYGNIPISTTTNPPSDRDWTGISTSSSFHGRTFLRSGITGGSDEPYKNNYVFDDISGKFTGINSTFTLTQQGENISGFSTSNGIVLVNNIFQIPQGSQAEQQDYTFEEGTTGISSIKFTGTISAGGPTDNDDVNVNNVPSGGRLISVGSTPGLGYQPLVSAGATVTVSVAGTISAISIGNSGSGYRVGIQTVVNVGIRTVDTGSASLFSIGTASIQNGHVVSIAITNPGTGYTTTNVPTVFIDPPLSYSDLSLIYHPDSPYQGIGTGAKINVIVGQGSSIIDFEITNPGFGYQPNEILTIAGIPTTGLINPFEDFKLTVERTFSDKFSGLSVGDLQLLDSLDDSFDGFTREFTLSIENVPITIRSKVGSVIDIKAALLVFVNDILQVPDESYIFDGGSVITFLESPKVGDKCRILFYKGTGDVDVLSASVVRTVKSGDTLEISHDKALGQNQGLSQEERTVTKLLSSDIAETTPYAGVGVNTSGVIRPVTWCKQQADKFIDGKLVSKSRDELEMAIYPTTVVIQPVGVGSNRLFVRELRPMFFPNNESNSQNFQKEIVIYEQDTLVSAAATAVVSAAGTISSLTISNFGRGYRTAPSVTIANPVGLGTTARATATATIAGIGSVASLSITSPGVGYTSSNPPVVLFGDPLIEREKIGVSSYAGDSGVIVGFGTTTFGSQTQFIFDLFVPVDSYLRHDEISGYASTISGITTSDYFVTFNTNVGSANTERTSYRTDNSIVAIGTQFIDNVYEVADYQVIEKNIVGVGSTYVKRIFTNIAGVSSDISEFFSSTTLTFDSDVYTFDSRSFTVYDGTVEDGNYFGQYTWGRIDLGTRGDANSYNFYGENGIGGISTSALVRRFASYKYNNYITNDIP